MPHCGATLLNPTSCFLEQCYEIGDPKDADTKHPRGYEISLGACFFDPRIFLPIKQSLRSHPLVRKEVESGYQRYFVVSSGKLKRDGQAFSDAVPLPSYITMKGPCFSEVEEGIKLCHRAVQPIHSLTVSLD